MLPNLLMFSAIFVTIAVCCFGIHWPSYVRQEINFVTEVRMDYSLYLPIPCIFFLIAVGILIIVEIRTSLLRIIARGHTYPEEHLKQVQIVHLQSTREESL